MVERINIDERPEDADWLKSLQRDDDPELYIGSPTREAARKKRELGSKNKFHARHDQKSHGRRKGGKGVRVIAGAGASKQTVAEVQAEMDRLAKDNPAIAKLMTDSTLSVTIVGTTTEKVCKATLWRRRGHMQEMAQRSFYSKPTTSWSMGSVSSKRIAT